MSRIVITIDAPDGTLVQVNPPDAGAPAGTMSVRAASLAPQGPEYVPPFADELIPLPDQAIPLPNDVNVQPGYAQGAAIAPVPFRGAAMGGNDPRLCPVHHEPWKTVPAGISKKTGQPYNAFAACPVRGCTQRPAAA